jgi:hypothetical protein
MALSRWFDARRQPGVAVEEVAEGVEFADAPFGGSGQVGLDDREAGEPGEGPPGAAGAALLDLDRPDCPLCFVVSADVQVRAGSEAQDQVLEGQEAAGDPAGVFGGRGAAVEVGGEPARVECLVAGDPVLQDGGVQGGLPGKAGGGCGVAGLGEQAGQPGCPFLLPGSRRPSGARRAGNKVASFRFPS